MKAHIGAHNRKILSKNEELSEGCNCRENGDPCPLGGQCLQGPMVYKATVTTKESNPICKTYHGMTGDTFKKQYGGHKSDLKQEDKYGTTLSLEAKKYEGQILNQMGNQRKGLHIKARCKRL